MTRYNNAPGLTDRILTLLRILKGSLIGLLTPKVEPIPVVLPPLNPLPLPSPEGLKSRAEIYEWIRYGIGCFREWYQPVDFGEGVIAHVTTPPDWTPKPERLHMPDNGLAKWNHTIRRYIPDITGKRVLDLGCSSGVCSIELAKLGAREVVGVDRNEVIQHRSTTVPPMQDVIGQANFVKKAHELLAGVSYPINYVAGDIGRLEELKLGRFDLIIALCVIYHELDRAPALVEQLASMTDLLILQASQGHTGELAEWAHPIREAEMLLAAGFTQVEIDTTFDSVMPMLVARKGDAVIRR